MSDEDNKLISEDQPGDIVENRMEDQLEDPTGNADDNKPEEIASGKTTKKKCRGSSFALIFLILIGGLTGGSYYLWKQLQQTRTDLAEMENNVQAQSGQTTGNISAMEDVI